MARKRGGSARMHFGAKRKGMSGVGIGKSTKRLTKAGQKRTRK